MFLLKIESPRLERLLEHTAELKEMSVERFAKLAFVKGLRKIAESAKPETKTSKAIKEYILAHWESKTDIQMGRVLGYSFVYIQRIRLRMGLKRKKGPDTERDLAATPVTDLPLTSTEKRRKKYEALDPLIREHWQTKDDWEIGRLLDPVVDGTTVRLRRYKLDLKRKKGEKSAAREGLRILDQIDGLEFERMVLREGYTMTDYLKFKDLRCSRERLRQVAEQLGLKHSPEDREPSWLLMRKARELGNFNLANREWLTEKIAQYQSMATLAAELKIREPGLYFFIRSFKLFHPSFRKHGAETVNLMCTKCGKGFVRLKRWVDKPMQKTNGRAQEFFCSQSCSGQWNRERTRKGIEESSAKQLAWNQARLEKKERYAAYIREHWQNQSDVQMALALNLSESFLTKKRLELGLRRA